ncbi:MAG: RNA polymerase sigma factor [Deltaproteobacteria bacterium]
MNEIGDEVALVSALRRNDSAAYETLVRRFGGQMLAAARRYLPGEQDCADAVQDAFVAAFKAIDDFKGESQLGSWMHRIVINACLMKIRSRSRRHEISIDALLPTFDASGHHARAVPRWTQKPDEKLQSDETRTIVRRCIEMLPDDFRSVVLLRDIEEFSTEEAAAALKITPGAVKTRLHRARQALRTLLEPHFVK